MSALTGALPEPADPSDLVLFVGCDSVYAVRHAMPLAYSLDDAAPGRRLHLHVVNPADGLDDALAALDEDLPETVLSVTTETVDLSGYDAVGRCSYYAAIRFVRAFQIMEAAPAGYLLLDADSLIRRPPDEAAKALEAGADLGLMIDEAMPAHMRIKAGGVLIAPTEAGRKFLAAVAANVYAHLQAGTAPWFLDQTVLWQVWQAMQDDAPPRTHRFSDGFLDWAFGEDGVVWTGKGERKHADPAFAALADRYRERFGREAAAARFWRRAA